jgi:hypothetical protein
LSARSFQRAGRSGLRRLSINWFYHRRILQKSQAKISAHGFYF